MTLLPDPAVKNAAPFPGLVVRPMLAADLASVLEVERSTPGAPHWSVQDYQGCIPGPSPAHPPRQGLERRAWVIQSSIAEPCIAECSPAEPSPAPPPRGGILGFAVVRGLSAGPRLEFELESFVVRPEAQERGVGRTLLATVLCLLKTSGAATLMLEVRASSLTAIRMYEAAGLIRSGIRKGYYGGYGGTPAEDAVLMHLEL